MPTIQWTSLALTKKVKTLELPEGSYDIHVEFGGWTSSRDIYVWWKDRYGLDQCKKIVSTKWRSNLKEINFQVLDGK